MLNDVPLRLPALEQEGLDRIPDVRRVFKFANFKLPFLVASYFTHRGLMNLSLENLQWNDIADLV